MSDAAEVVVEEPTLEDEVLDNLGLDDQPEPPKDEEPPKEPEPVKFSDEQQAIFNDEIGKKVARQREAERERDAERERAAKLEEELAKYKETARPEIPPIPDPMDDDFQEKLQVREQTMAAAIKWDAEQEAAQKMRQEAAEAAQRKEQEALVAKVQTYSGRAEKLGIKPEELQVAGNQVAQFGVLPDVAQHILEDEQGPSITMYLAQNPLELEAMRSMSPLQAAIYIENNVKEKAVAARPKVDAPPPPVETPDAAALPDTGGMGITFE